MKQTPTVDSCYAYPWLLGMGFAIMFGGLFAKTWRLWRLFSTKSLKAQVITNSTVFIGVAGFVLPMAIFLIIWSSVDGFTVIEEFSTSEPGYVRFMCHTPSAWWPIFAAMSVRCYSQYLSSNLHKYTNEAYECKSSNF